jgi:hypothetical protein
MNLSPSINNVGCRMVNLNNGYLSEESGRLVHNIEHINLISKKIHTGCEFPAPEWTV